MTFILVAYTVHIILAHLIDIWLLHAITEWLPENAIGKLVSAATFV